MSGRSISFDMALSRMASLCSRSEYCISEINNKLWSMGLSESQREEILSILIDKRFLDDGRFAKAFAYSKMKFSGWGLRKIYLSLARKRVDAELIREALDSIDRGEYEEVFRKVLISKSRGVNFQDVASVRRLYSSMLSRGFEGELVKRGIFELQKGQG